MKSLWSFMREKHITEAVRCSLENFGDFSYTDKEDADAVRHRQRFPSLCCFTDNKIHNIQTSVKYSTWILCCFIYIQHKIHVIQTLSLFSS